MAPRRLDPRLALLCTALLAICAAGAAVADSSGMEPQEHVAAPIPSLDRVPEPRTVPYVVPDITLVRDDGKTVSLAREMDDGRPVLLNFIFTSCGSICPLMSQIFAQFQAKLGDERPRFHLMSISIDPEYDTPERLVEYARRFGAGPGWQHYTGTLDASLKAQRAFDVYRGDKMSHAPVTLLRAAPGEPWRRIEGFVTSDELLHEYRRLLASQ